VRRAGTLARPPWALELTADDAEWTWSSLRVLELPAGSSCSFETKDDEILVVPLEGSCDVASGGMAFALAGREDVFCGASDFAYVPKDAQVTVSSIEGGRFAVPGARASKRLPFRYQPADKVVVELRGAGRCSRRVTNLCMGGEFAADMLIVCEVFTPSGNWSSYPPHKHDEDRPGEAVLEEIYYFEVADGPGGPGVAFQRVYGTADRPIDVLAEVRSGDIVLVPHGWHGPSMAPPGYDLYYLNVMAGPGRREWLATNDPTYSWVRDTWADEEVDPRISTRERHGAQ
jgi:5-deoxy-glucuronate isomerase